MWWDLLAIVEYKASVGKFHINNGIGTIGIQDIGHHLHP